MQDPIFSLNTAVLSAQAMTGNATSASVDISDVAGYAVHAIYTGSPVGSLIVEGSNDPAASSFAQITSISISAAGQTIYDVPKCHYRLVRTRYVFTSGTGSLTCYISAKKI